MYSSLAMRRAGTAIAGLLIAGSGVLATTPALAAVPAPGTGAGGSAATSHANTGPASAATVPAKGGADSTTAAEPANGGQGAAGSAGPAHQGSEPRGRVVSRLPLSIRQYATTESRALGSLQPGAVIALHCKVVGQNVDGNDRWYRLGAGRTGYVAARYVDNLSVVPWC